MDTFTVTAAATTHGPCCTLVHTCLEAQGSCTTTGCSSTSHCAIRRSSTTASQVAEEEEICTCPDASEAAWSMVLQHPALSTDTPSICRLLCVSWGMQQAVEHSLAGQLQLNVSVEQGGSSKAGIALRHWLCAHGSLVKSLRFKQVPGLECNRPEQQQQVSQVAAGFKSAVARGSHLQVRSLASNVCARLLLESLPCLAASLAHLELGPFCTEELHREISDATTASAATQTMLSPASSADTLSADAATASSALLAHAASSSFASSSSSLSSAESILTAAATRGADPADTSSTAVLATLPVLSSLSLQGYAANALLPAMYACTQIHSLSLSNLLCSKAYLLHNLPAQLRDLRVLVDPDFTSWQRKQRQPVLSHLTALTHLSCTGEGLFAVQPDEVLPPSLVELVVSDCPKAQPLLPLRRLQVLVMQASTMNAEQLQQLPATLPALREVRLGHDRGNMDAIIAAAPGWPLLRGLITGLDLKVYPGPLPAQTLPCLAQLGPALTRLAISGFSVEVEATPAVFAAALSGLVGLQELKLAYLRLKDENLPPGAAAAAAAGASPAAVAATVRVAISHATYQAELAEAAAAAAAAPAATGAEPGAASDASTSMQAAAADPNMAAAGTVAEDDHQQQEQQQQPVYPSNGLTVLMKQIAALPALKNLSLHSMVLTGEPVAALADIATGLTALQLNECDLCDADVRLLAGRLPRLRRLTLNWNFAVRSTGLMCVSQLKDLKELHVCCGTTRHEAALVTLQQLLPGLIAAS